MANTFVSLNFVGTPVDVSLLAPDKTIVVQGDVPEGTLVIEGSTDGGSNFAPLATLNLFELPLTVSLHAVITHIRALRTAGAGAMSIAVGAEVSTANVFATFNVPSIAGTGVPLDTSTFGPDKTIIVTGANDGIVIEGSNDGGVTYDPALQFSNLAAEGLDLLAVYSRMRVRRKLVTNSSVVVIAIGSAPAGTGGTPGAQGFQGVQGNQGPLGPQGFSGTGSPGAQGFQGLSGPQGFQGTPGGGTGAQGAQGPQGTVGPLFLGPQGAQGNQGGGINAATKVYFSAKIDGAVGAVQQVMFNTDVFGITPTSVASFPGFPTKSITTFYNMSRVKATVNTLTDVCTVTVYLNGVATAAFATIPAGSTALLFGSIVFSSIAAGTLVALVVDIPAGQAGNSITLGALLTLFH